MARLVVGGEHVRQHRCRLAGRHHGLVVPPSDPGDQTTGPGPFVGGRTVEAEREGPQRLARVPCGQRGDQTRIQAGGQEHAQGNVTDQLPLDGVLQEVLNLFLVDTESAVLLLLETAVPVARLPGIARRHEEGMPRGQATYAAEKRVRFRHGEPRQIVRQRRQIDLRIHEAGRQEAFDLGGEHEPVRCVGVDQRLHAQTIPGHEEPARSPIPHREGPHAVEAGHDLRPPLRVTAEDYLGVAA